MGKTAFLRDDSPNALAMRVVVTAAGAAVARRYEPRDLHDGDVGIQVRFDRGKLAELGMTAEQRTTAQALARDMTAELHAALGIAEPGFKPGMVVEVVPDDGENYYGCVVRETESGLILQTVDTEGRVRTTFAPFRFTMNEVAERTGMDGVVGAMLEVKPLDHCFSAEGAVRVVEHVKDETALVGITRFYMDSNRDEARKKAAAKVRSQEWLVKLLHWEHPHGDHGKPNHYETTLAITEGALARITDDRCLMEAVHVALDVTNGAMFDKVAETARRIKDPIYLEETIVMVAGRPQSQDIAPRHRVCMELLGLLDEARLEALFNRMNDRGHLQSWILGCCTSVDFVVEKVWTGNIQYLKLDMVRACLARLTRAEDADIRKSLERRLHLLEATTG